MLRDVLLGIHPPTLFLKPVYVTVAVIAAIIIFLLMRSKNISRFLLTAEYYDWTMNLLDAIGLGAFTVVGVNTSISAGQGNFQFFKSLDMQKFCQPFFHTVHNHDPFL